LKNIDNDHEQRLKLRAAAAKAPGSNQEAQLVIIEGWESEVRNPIMARQVEVARRKRVNQQGKTAAAVTVTGGAPAATAGASTEQQETRTIMGTRDLVNGNEEGKMCRATDAENHHAAAPKPAPVAAGATHQYTANKTIPLLNCKLLHWKSPHPHVPLAIEQPFWVLLLRRNVKDCCG
jgi:hypothetical protein